MYRRARNIGLSIQVEWPRVAGSGKCHVRGPRLKAGVAHAAILRGKHHNHAWPMQKMPRVCEVISGLYCSFFMLLLELFLFSSPLPIDL